LRTSNEIRTLQKPLSSKEKKNRSATSEAVPKAITPIIGSREYAINLKKIQDCQSQDSRKDFKS